MTSDGHIPSHGPGGDPQGVIEALTRLLEAERAGARAGAQLAKAADDPEMQALTRTIQRDEARWCGVLADALRRLGAAPSGEVGAFYAKVMAIDGFEARLAFMNRGQAWVVRKIEELLPRIRDERLHADLRAMLDAHVANIELTEGALARRDAGRTAREPPSPGRR